MSTHLLLARVIVTMFSFALGLALSFYVAVGYRLAFLAITPGKLWLAGSIAFVLEMVVAWNIQFFWSLDETQYSYEARSTRRRHERETLANRKRDPESSKMRRRAEDRNREV